MSLHCDHCGAEVDATVRFEEDDDRGIWLRCTNSDCDRSGRFGGDGIRVVDRGRGVATDGGAEVTDATIHHYECQGCGAELDWVEIDTCPSCGSDELKEIHVIADGGEVSESFERPGRPDPEDDPYSCSICGAPLGEVSRVEGFDHCRGCRREHGPDEHTEIRTDGGQEVGGTDRFEESTNLQYGVVEATIDEEDVHRPGECHIVLTKHGERYWLTFHAESDIETNILFDQFEWRPDEYTGTLYLKQSTGKHPITVAMFDWQVAFPRDGFGLVGEWFVEQLDLDEYRAGVQCPKGDCDAEALHTGLASVCESPDCDFYAEGHIEAPHDDQQELATDGGKPVEESVSRNQHPVYKQELLEEAKDAQEPVTDVERTHEGQCITVAACQEHDGIGWLCTIEDDRRFDGEPRVNFLKSRWDSDLEVMRKWSRQAAGRSSAPERKPGWDSLFTVYNTASHVYRQEVDDA